MSLLKKAVTALARQFVLPQTPVERVAQTPRWRGLTIGNLSLLTPDGQGGEIVEDPKIFRLPHTPAWCRGLINLRGQLIPVFDLHEYFDVCELRASRQWLLVIGRGEDAFALFVDALPESITVATISTVNPGAIPQRLRSHVGTACRVGTRLWLEFHFRSLLQTLAAQEAA